MTIEELMAIAQREQTNLMALVLSGIFEMRNGSITIHYDNDGVIRKVEKNQTTFKS